MSDSNESSHISIDVEADASIPDVDRANQDARTLAQERAKELVGQVLSGRYRIVDLIAMGGMGAVYLGEHVHMHKRIAVKMLHPESEDHPEIVARFEREALVGAHVNHPNIAHATDFGKLDDGSYFLVLEYVEGKNLADLIREGPMPAPRVARIARQIASALATTHELGIVHRDLKPRNVMVEEGSVPKLIDFGCAKVSVKKLPLTVGNEGRPPSRLTGVGVIFGTINYLAPEAAHGMDAVDERADLYALGVMMYEMLAGKHPFDSTDPVEMFGHHRTTKPPAFAERVPGLVVPPELDAVVRKLLEKDPYERYQTANEVVAAIEALGIEEEPPATSAVMRGKTPAPPSVARPKPEPAAEKPAVEDEAKGADAKEAATTTATRKVKKGAKKTGTKPREKEAASAPPKGGSINVALAIIAVVAVAAAAFFATR